MFKKKVRTPQQKLMRRYRGFQVGFFSLLIALGFIVYFNYDYWVFKFLIANNYVFTEALDELYTQHIYEENRRSFHRDFDRMVISVVTQQIREINADRFTYLYSPQQHEAVREWEATVARRARIESLTEDTVLLYIPNMSLISSNFVYDNRQYLAGYRNLVLDLRGNPGGLLEDFHWMAGLFIGNRAVIAHETTRWRLFSRTIRTPRRDAFFDFDEIIILQNTRTASAAEGLILALQAHLPNVRTIGYTTFGKGIGQVTIPLTGGYAVRATVMLLEGPNHESIHVIGITPDIPAEEDMIAQALRLLYESCLE